jgi:Tfp pilus assembly protein PilZ
MLRHPIRFEVLGTKRFFEGRAQDVSLGGMFIETDLPASYGSEVVIEIRVGDAGGGKDTLRLPARVRWRRAGGMGVQFAALGARETHELLAVAATGAQ